ncbi:helix-turn-helix domain-containing protein [Onishia taeanensis]
MNQPSSSKLGPASVEELIIEVLALRLRLNMSQRAFAHKLGISSRTYQDWEQGRRRPSGPARTLLERGLKELGSDH